VRSFAIIPTQPNKLCAALHNRIPIVLQAETWPAWLSEQPASVSDLKGMLAPYLSDEMIAWPVSPRVGNVKNNDPSLIEPIVLTLESAMRFGADVIRSLRYPRPGAVKPMPEAEIAKAMQLLDLMLEYFADDGHWTRGRYDDGNGGHCLVGALLRLSRQHSLPRAPAIALLQDAMPRPGLPLVHFNDICCSSAAELRSIIHKARRLVDDQAEQERAAAAAKTWLLAQIAKKRTMPSDITDTAPEPFAPERLAA
jgi:hypothetical protein